MKLIAIKPIYHNSNVVVEQETFETNEQHGRELVAKGYAVEVQVNLSLSGLVPVSYTHLTLPTTERV